MVDFDEYIDHIGGFGTYQKRFFYLLACPCIIFGSFGAFVNIYLLYTPPGHCKIPESLEATFMDASNRSLIDVCVPKKPYKGSSLAPSQCTIFDYSPANWTFMTNVTNETSCPIGYVHDKTDWDDNVVTEFDLVCDRTWVVSMLYTVAGIGGTIGTLGTAFAQDNYGRKKTFFAGVAFMMTVGCCCYFAKNWQVLAALMFIKALANSTFFNQPWVLTIEMIDDAHRTFALIVTCMSFAIGVIFLTGITYLCRTWQQTVLAVNLPGYIFLLFYPFVDESPRWMLTVGRRKEAVKVLKRMARINKVDINHINVDEVTVKNQNSEKDSGTHGPWTIFQSWSMTLKTIIISWINTVVSMVYYGLTINTEHLGGNIFLVFMLISMVEVPAALLAKFGDIYGRVWPTSASLFVAALAAVLSAFVPATSNVAIIFLAVLTKLAITCAFDVIVLLGGELYPTVVRGSGLAVSFILPSVLSIATPYIVSLAHIWAQLPMLIFGLMSLSAGILVLFLPESLGHPLPDTLEDEKLRPVGWKSFMENVTFKAVRHARSVTRKIKQKSETPEAEQKFLQNS